jgi:predicted DNA-binding transcriptional regulator AlpA
MSERVIVIPESQATVSVAQLAAILQVLPSTVYRLNVDGELPAPVGGSSLAWKPEDIQAWVKTRVPGKWRRRLPNAAQK